MNVFIVGFERCGTTSLARYLVNAGIPLLVPGIKEPYVFLRDYAPPPGTWLDASVCYIMRTDALRRITALPDYRIIVSLRNPIDRVVSAWSYYREAINNPDRVRKLVGRYTGRYAYTPILTDVCGLSEVDADRVIETLMRQSFGERLIYELRERKRTGTYPQLSILANSHYPFHVAKLLSIVDPVRVMFTTAGDHRAVANWLGVETNDQMPHDNSAQADSDARRLCDSILGAMFAAEAIELDGILAAHRSG